MYLGAPVKPRWYCTGYYLTAACCRKINDYDFFLYRSTWYRTYVFFVVLKLYVNYKTLQRQAELWKKGQLYTNHHGNEIIFRIASQSLYQSLHVIARLKGKLSRYPMHAKRSWLAKYRLQNMLSTFGFQKRQQQNSSTQKTTLEPPVISFKACNWIVGDNDNSRGRIGRSFMYQAYLDSLES